MKRLLPALAAGVILAGTGASAAVAATSEAPYWPTGSDGVEVSSERVAPGDAVVVTFAGFRPFSTVTITLSLSGGEAMTTSLGRLALVSAQAQTFTEQADGVGVVTLDVTLPEAGTFDVAASGVDASGAPRTVQTQVVAAAPAGQGVAEGRADEGGPTVAILALGAGLAVTAGATAYVVRRRVPQSK